jgi:hypothetical protein
MKRKQIDTTNLRIVSRSLSISDAYPRTIEAVAAIRLISPLIEQSIAGDECPRSPPRKSSATVANPTVRIS